MSSECLGRIFSVCVCVCVCVGVFCVFFASVCVCVFVRAREGGYFVCERYTLHPYTLAPLHPSPLRTLHPYTLHGEP